MKELGYDICGEACRIAANDPSAWGWTILIPIVIFFVGFVTVGLAIDYGKDYIRKRKARN